MSLVAFAVIVRLLLATGVSAALDSAVGLAPKLEAPDEPDVFLLEILEPETAPSEPPVQPEIAAASEAPAEQETEENGSISIAVVGKPNAGKSSLVNKILGQERTIVSDIPGTTRDAIDTGFIWQERPFNIVDTAGIRRKRSVDDDSIERYSVIRSLDAIRRCDVALIVVDAVRA